MTSVGGMRGGATQDQAARELMWNLGAASHVAMYVLMAIAFLIFAWGLRRRIREWKAGKPTDESFAAWGRRALVLARETLLQNRTRGRFLPGLFHSLVFYSFGALFVTTLVVMADMDFGIPIYRGTVYLFFTILSDLAAALLLIGLAIAAARRYIARPRHLPEPKPADAVILGILAFLVLTGLLAEGARMRFHPDGDPWRAYAPIGALFSSMLAGLSPQAGRTLHFLTWWTHALGTFAMIALIPHTKFFHMLAIPANQYLSKQTPTGSLARVDIESLLAKEDAEFEVGVARCEQLTWKQRLDLDACIECGRCDEVCPAWATGQPLSPRRLIEDLKRMARAPGSPDRRDRALESPGAGASGAIAGSGEPAASVPQKPIIGVEGTVFSDPQFIWHCRTCHACQTDCPAAIRHVDLFVELRRAEVMMEGRIPADAGRALRALEAQGNPFGPQAARLEFVERLGIPVVEPGGETEILLWIGCVATYDPEKQKSVEDLVAILRHAGVPFGHLGRDETCCGDPARVLGDENLFQSTAKRTIEALQSRRFKTLLVSCPHGYNAFAHEYPGFGATFPVKHHSQLLAEWLAEGRLRAGERVEERVAYHDPCYLGRYQGLWEPPRRALRSLPGLQLREMRHRMDSSHCCGAGGGHYWMDLDSGDHRPYTRRVDEAVASGAGTIAVGCAFCQQMLVDGLKARDLEERLRVVDLATLVRRSLGI